MVAARRGTPISRRMTSAARPARARRVQRAGAVGFALAVHALLLLAVLLAWRSAPPPDAPAPAFDMAPPTPFPRVPPAPVGAHRAGGSPASAPKKAAPSTPVAKPQVVPPQPVKPPPPVDAAVPPTPAPTITAPVGPALASPVTGAGAGAATGEGTGTGSGPGGPGGPALLDPDWVSWFGPEEVERAYPLAAFKAGTPGRAVLSCLGLKDGRVKDCRVVGETPQGQGFGRAALGLARFCRFRPLTADGRPVEARLRIPIDFSVGD